MQVEEVPYGLNQSPRIGHQIFDTYILGLGFVRIWAKHCVYSKLVGNVFVYVVLYVNNMLLVGKTWVLSRREN